MNRGLCPIHVRNLSVPRNGRGLYLAQFLAAALILASGWELPAAPVNFAEKHDEFFLKRYEKALDLLGHTDRLGVPLVASSYDAIKLFEQCAQTELSFKGRGQASEMLNERLSKPSFAKAYSKYKKKRLQDLGVQDIKVVCQALAEHRTEN